MSDRYVARTTRWVLVVAVIGVVSVAGLTARPAVAGKLEKLDTSLKLIPHDAAFYSSMLRNKEQIEAINGSRAWAKLNGMPIVQMGKALWAMQAANPESVPGKIQAALDDPQNRELIELVCDMFSDEVFFYGDTSFADFLELAQQIAGDMRYGPTMMQLAGQAKGIDQNELQIKLLLAVLSENLDLVKVPNMVVGFKLSDTDRASELLDELGEWVTTVEEAKKRAATALGSKQKIKDRFKRTKIAGHQYLVLSLDGQMIPWNKLNVEELEEKGIDKEDVDKVITKLKKLPLVIALGIRDDYLLLSIGSSTKCLARLGKGKRLVDQPEFAPLEKFTDKRLASIGYLSKAMSARVNNSKQEIDKLLEAVDDLLPLSELKPEQKAQIRKDAAALAEGLKKLVPEPGPVMTLSFLTDQGIEGYQYNWSECPQLDGSKPLPILEHLGGNPLLYSARAKYEVLLVCLKDVGAAGGRDFRGA